MYDSNLNLQTPTNKLNQRNQNQYSASSVKNAQVMNNLSAEIDEGEFVLIGANSLSARFNPPKAQPQSDFGKMGKKSATSINILVKTPENEKDGGNPTMDILFGPILSMVFPGMHILEMLNHGREAFEKINEGVNKNMYIQETRNINPVDAINPSKAFLPVTPFYAPTKPEPLLWDRVRNERASKEEENKKKKSNRMKIGAL